MYIIYGTIHLFMPYSASLKDKRQIVRSIVARTRNRFNMSMSEVGEHDLWQRSRLGFAAVCSDYGETQAILRSVRDILDKYDDSCHITAFDHEVLRVD